MDNAPIIDLHNVVKQYGAGESAIFALDGVSLSIY
ncbi:MAG: macrolide ABC transporter ATP-binding protein, partial [Actinobacteria bacterium]|nr:macrolide ABC transporter ATP-binding protein [Actinomycetota bacterium]